MRGRSERKRESYIRRRGEGSIDQVGREAAGALYAVRKQLSATFGVRMEFSRRGREKRTSFQNPSRCGVCPSEMREKRVVQC